MEPTYIAVHHNGKHYRVLMDSKTGLVIDPEMMYKQENEITEEEALEINGWKEERDS